MMPTQHVIEMKSTGPFHPFIFSHRRHILRVFPEKVVVLGALCLLSACERDRMISAPGSQVYVNTDPPGATLIWDDHVADHPAPTTLLGLAPGDHLMVARKTGYVEAMTTVATRAGERVAVEMKLEPLRGLVLIHSKPPAADVEINNAHYGQTPLLIPDFPLGQHRIKLSAPEYMPKLVEVTVSDRTPKKIDVTLISDSAKLSIESRPPGAQALLDGSVIGNTPCQVPRLSTGKHRIQVTLKGHSTYQDEFTVQPGEERNISAHLTALPGKLSVVSIPVKTRIYINDQFKAEAPFVTNTIPAGQYVLRAELPGYATQIRTNVIVVGGESVVEFHLVKNSGTLLLSTEPAGVAVYLDGEHRGVTPARGQEPVSDQWTIDLVPQGQHKLQFTRQGYYDLAKTVNVASNQTLILHEKLVMRPVPFIPTVTVVTGPDAEHAFKGIIREKYRNGDIKLEIEPGIFKTFKASEIRSIEPIRSPE